MISVRNRNRFNELFWGPWAELERFQRELGQVSHRQQTTSRASNVYADTQRVVVQLALPGFNKESLEIAVEGKTLTVRGQRPDESEVNYRRREFGLGRFERVFELPFAIADEGLSASLENGVLEVLLPRAEADKPRHIKINA